MSNEIVEEPFDSAAAKVEEAHQLAVNELKSKIEKAKVAALKKVRP